MAMIYLITELFGLTSATISALANGYVLFLFAMKRVRSPDSLRLAFYLSMADLGYALAASIHLGYLAINWSNEYLDYNPYFIIISNCFLPAQLKIIITISISLAIDRILAIYRPVLYHRTSRIQCANVVLTIGLGWFLFDFLFQLFTAQYERNPNCATMACFVNKNFLAYTSYSNSIVGLLTLLMSTVVFVGIRSIQSKKANNSVALKSSSNFQQANRICIGILFSSLFFVTIPSVLVSFYEKITGVSLFAELGPFYITCILLNGIAESLILLMANKKLILFRMKNRLHNNTQVTFSQPPVENTAHTICYI